MFIKSKGNIHRPFMLMFLHVPLKITENIEEYVVQKIGSNWLERNGGWKETATVTIT